MRTSVRHPVGVEVTGLSLRDLDSGAVTKLKGLLAEHGVVVLRDQHIDDAGFVDALRRLGELTFTKGETPVPGFPDLNVVSNVGRSTPPRSSFHVDTSYFRRPPAYTALRAVQVPTEGGATQFTNQYAAYETLTDRTREVLADRIVTHVATGVDLDDDDEAAAEHPLFRRHPISGRTALYLSTPARCVAVSGMTPAEAEETIAELYEHSTAERNVYRHSWSGGDVVIWDNLVVLHRADHEGVVGDRVLHRGLVAG